MEPLIKPGSWVLFRLNKQNVHMSQITGAFWEADEGGDRWGYVVTNPLGDKPLVIPEGDVYKWLDGKVWKVTRSE